MVVQLVERLLPKEKVAGSNPVHRSKINYCRCSSAVEQSLRKGWVGGSIPLTGSKTMNRKFKRNKQSKIQTSYIYKSNSSIKSEEKKVIFRLILLVLIIIGFAVVLYLWGIDLVAFIGNHQNTTSTNISPKANKSIIAPHLFDLTSLVKTKQVVISGVATSGTEVEIFVNNISVMKLLVNEDGTFSNSNVELIEGNNSIYAITHYQNQVSDMSNILTIELDTQKPVLTYTTLTNKETKLITFSGSVEGGSALYINERRIILLPDNSFTIEYNLVDSESEYLLTVEDQAGNQNTYSEKIESAD